MNIIIDNIAEVIRPLILQVLKDLGKYLVLCFVFNDCLLVLINSDFGDERKATVT